MVRVVRLALAADSTGDRNTLTPVRQHVSGLNSTARGEFALKMGRKKMKFEILLKRNPAQAEPCIQNGGFLHRR